ncbi:hypothetical protein T459_04454 [Capsicum annuum]|uniref:Ubiquitin-like protease family profile domain-containing protein n=1 Tax=Capsicum annuum TaxID=4072 RepID=A0A2G3A575_CAPAN|nr:hypothetical protein T459_04454 [Capsicum annuum]
MGKSFDVFRKILREQKLDAYFRDSFFGKYLDLPEDNNTHFQMKIVYDLLRHRFMYENKDKMDEVWINYYNILICFGGKKFVIVTGLKCYLPSPSQVIPILTQKALCILEKGKVKTSDGDGLVSLVGQSFNKKSDRSIESDEFHWVLAVVVLKEKRNRVYDSMSGRRYSGPLPEIQKLAKILTTYLDIIVFYDQKVCTDWSMIEAYRDTMENPFEVEYIEEIAQQPISSL